MIARIWRGAVRSSDAKEYIRYIDETGMAEYQRCAGNRGAWMLSRDLGDGRTEIVTLSFWDTRESIHEFAGAEIERAVFYPEDERFLIERDLSVTHYEVAGPPAGPVAAAEVSK
jgi:heme-degrading monooxygenase HmoA